MYTNEYMCQFKIGSSLMREPPSSFPGLTISGITKNTKGKPPFGKEPGRHASASQATTPPSFLATLPLFGHYSLGKKVPKAPPSKGCQ